MIHDWFIKYGSSQSDADPCMYVKRDGDKILVVIIYVDDLMIAGNSKSMIQLFKQEVSKSFLMKDLGALKWMLGMEIIRNRAVRTVEVKQTAYIEQVLARFGMSNCKPVSTPMDKDLVRCMEKNSTFDYAYAQMVGSLMYAGVISRPEIMYAVQNLARQMQATTPEYHKAAKWLLRYLQGTKELGIKLGGVGKTVELVCYCDADWGSNKECRRSTTGYVFMLGGGAVSWSSRLQTTVALSTAEAEYMALNAAVQEAIYLRRSLKALGFEQKGPTKIMEDNQGCIAMAANPIQHKRTKHIDIKYHFTRQSAKDGHVSIEYVPTEHQLGDLFTKPLQRIKLEYFRRLILGYSS